MCMKELWFTFPEYLQAATETLPTYFAYHIQHSLLTILSYALKQNPDLSISQFDNTWQMGFDSSKYLVITGLKKNALKQNLDLFIYSLRKVVKYMSYACFVVVYAKKSASILLIWFSNNARPCFYWENRLFKSIRVYLIVINNFFY